MSNAETLLNRLLTASKGVTTAERQAQSRIKTTEYVDLTKKELKGEALLAALKVTETDIGALRTATSDIDNTAQIEVYDAALSVFTKFADAKDAA